MIIPSTILQLWKIQSTSLSTSTVCSNIYCFNGIIEKHRVPNSNFLLTPSTLSTQPTLDALRTNQEETHVELYASKNNNGSTSQRWHLAWHKFPNYQGTCSTALFNHFREREPAPGRRRRRRYNQNTPDTCLLLS